MSAEIDLYEAAFLCGGPDRAARTALVSLFTSGVVEIGDAPAYRLTKKQRRAGSAVEVAMLDKISGAGLPVKLVLKTTGESSAVLARGAALIEAKLLRRSLRGTISMTRAGEEMRDSLAETAPDDAETSLAERFAVHGAEALEEGPLLSALESLPDEGGIPRKLARPAAKGGFDERGHYSSADHSGGAGF